MRLTIPILILVLALVKGQEESGTAWNLAEQCNEACQLPDCRCSSTNIPAGLAARDVPQFVTLTFDDGINVLNIETYRLITNNYQRLNSNGCKSGLTFYINHEYTNYVLVNELYNNGYEIALHSVSHQTNQSYWQSATYDDMMREFGDQRIQMSYFANIPADTIKGIRSPFLQISGNSTYQVLHDTGMLFDCSWPTVTYNNPALWPYTLDYASTQDCVIGPCPNASIPGVWVMPMVSWIDLGGNTCSMADACFSIPGSNDEDGWYQFFVRNFERHYLGNRAPFGFYLHAAYFTVHPAVRPALVRFLDLLNRLTDVFMVNSSEVIDWIKNPVPVNEYIQRPCNTPSQTSCAPTNCGPLSSEHTQTEYWFQVCTACPRVYPWLGNPLGQ